MKIIDMYDFLADIGQEPYNENAIGISNIFWHVMKNPENQLQFYFWWRMHSDT